MSAVVVRYETNGEEADHNQELVEAVFAELDEKDPGGVRYATFRLADNTFVHIAEVDADPNPLATIDAFARFQDGIAQRCVESGAPNPQPAVLVGSYRFFETT